MLIHKLVEQGVLDLNLPVAHYLPEFGQLGKQKITLAHMLCHRSGFPQVPKEHASPELLYQPEKAYDLICNTPIQFPAGKVQFYHAITTGYVWKALVEKVCNRPMQQVLHDEFERPMQLPFFNYGLKPEYQARAALNAVTGMSAAFGADIYLERLLGAKTAQVVSATNDRRFMNTVCPSANIYTNADQLCQFVEMMLNNGTHVLADGKHVQILKPASIERAITPTAEAFDRGFLIPIRFGLGPLLGNNPFLYGPQSKACFGHVGYTNTLAFADPIRDISVVFLSTGKAITGSHLLPFVGMGAQLSLQCPVVPKAQRRGFFAK